MKYFLKNKSTAVVTFEKDFPSFALIESVEIYYFK